jgi:hypothetical protein
MRALVADEDPGPWRIGVTTVVLVAVVSIYVAITAPRTDPPPATNAATDALRGACEQRTEPRYTAGRATAAWPATRLQCVNGRRLPARALPARTPR